MVDDLDDQDVAPREYLRGITFEVGAHLESVTRCPDSGSSDLVEIHLHHARALRRLHGSIREIITGREGDSRFIDQCQRAYAARRDLADVEIRQQLGEWLPGLYGLSYPN